MESREIVILEIGSIEFEEPNFCGLCGAFCTPVVYVPHP